MDAILYVKNVLDLIMATNLIQTLLFLNIKTCLDIYPMFMIQPIMYTMMHVLFIYDTRIQFKKNCDSGGQISSRWQILLIQQSQIFHNLLRHQFVKFLIHDIQFVLSLQKMILSQANMDIIWIIKFLHKHILQYLMKSKKIVSLLVLIIYLKDKINILPIAAVLTNINNCVIICLLLMYVLIQNVFIVLKIVRNAILQCLLNVPLKHIQLMDHVIIITLIIKTILITNVFNQVSKKLIYIMFIVIWNVHLVLINIAMIFLT
ncbi:unnamed protein product [Paramecium primaurelia]|uniref:Transmembrane protein n=1 Tax=Paramecium primaurelia TaxID=5886 RepID=A0A8S1MUB5_PARPR|nr:unnamed protein product [Paramecium primaurelia]